MCSDKDNIVGDENNYQTETESESENEMRPQETKHNFLETIQVYSMLKEQTRCMFFTSCLLLSF